MATGWPCRSAPTSTSRVGWIPADEGPLGSGIPVRVYRRFGTGRRRRRCRSAASRRPSSTSTGAAGSAGDLGTHDASCRLLAASAGVWWWPSTTGWPPSTPFRRPSTTPWPPSVGAAPRRRPGGGPGPGRRHGGQRRGQPGRGGGPADPGRRGRPTPSCRAPVAQGLVYPAVDARLDTGSVRAWPRGSS